jgi:chemotaxis protein MotB
MVQHARQRDRERSSRDRWLVSYADLMTLLCALFAVLYAAGLDVTHLQSVAASLQSALALNAPADPPVETAVVQPVPPSVRPEQIEPTREVIVRELAPAIAARRVEIIDDTRGIVMSLPEAVTFASGSAEITPEAHDLIVQIGEILKPMAHEIAVEGHTDNVPIRTARYRSNWELSTARACAVVQILIEEAGLDPRRLGAAGYSEFRPRASNDSETNRARNRRVDIVVFDSEPAPAEASRDVS